MFIPERNDELEKNFNNNILPKYESDLLPKLIGTAIKTNNIDIIYFLLTHPWFENNLYLWLKDNNDDVLTLISGLNHKSLNLILYKILVKQIAHELDTLTSDLVNSVNVIVSETNWSKDKILSNIIVPAFLNKAETITDFSRFLKFDEKALSQEIRHLLLEIKTRYHKKIEDLNKAIDGFEDKFTPQFFCDILF